MTAEEKIDLLCSEHLNGLTTVWAVTKCFEDIKQLLIICEENGIINQYEHRDLFNHYVMCAGDVINIILEDIESNDTMILAQQLDLDKEDMDIDI